MLYDDSTDTWDRDSHFILDGVFHGFRVLDRDCTIPIYRVENYKSCYNTTACSKLEKTLHDKLINGKLSVTSQTPRNVHAMGALPKQNGNIRIITDCSKPNFISVNNYMKEVFSTFSYTKLDDVISQIGQGDYMATIDLESAYRAVPILPENRQSFGLAWDFGSGEVLMCDNFLGFGTKIAPFIFDRMTDSVSRFMQRNSFKCYNYLDDFIIIGSDEESTKQAQLLLIRTLRRLGFYISWPKTTSPSKVCKYLGIMIDSESQTVYLPQDKLLKLYNELQFWSNRKRASLKQLQVLCGILNYCCKVVRGGRIYMHHMIDLLKLFKNARRITLPESFHQDIEWWKTYAKIFNGKADFMNPEYNTSEIFTDACLSGLAGVYGTDYFQGIIIPTFDSDLSIDQVTDNLYNILVPIDHVANINILELLAIMVALFRWYSYYHNARVLINCDNLQVCYMLCKDRSQNKFANHCLRSIFWLCVSNNMYLSPCYIPSSANIIADTLSRTCSL